MDDYYNMMDDDDHEKLMEISWKENIIIDQFILHCLSFGYTYVNKDNIIIIPRDLLEKVLMPF